MPATVIGTPTLDPKTTATTSHIVTKPTGFQADEILWVQIVTNGTAVTTLAGWNASVAENTLNPRSFTYWRAFQTGDDTVSSWTFTMGSATSGSICTRISGADTTAPVEASAMSTGTASPYSSRPSAEVGLTDGLL